MTDTELFAAYFFPHYLYSKSSELHHDMLTDMADTRRNKKAAWAAPRDNSKSTVITLIKPMHRIAYKLERYIAIVGEIEKNASDKVMDIQRELEENQDFRDVYGDLVNKDHWLKTDIVTANGVRVQSFGCRTPIRGVKHGEHRPTLMIFDDVENRKLVKSPENRADLMDWFTKDALKAGQIGYTNYDFVGTVLHSDSLLSHLLKNPAWKGRLYRAVKSWPTTEARHLWDEWKHIYTDLGNPHREEHAQAYYEEREEAMLEGVVVLWPERQSFLELMKIIVGEGMSAFNTELMNSPINPDTAIFEMDQALRFHINEDIIVRNDGRMARLSNCRKYAYHDPAFGKTVHGDYAAIVVIAVDNFGFVYVIDVWIDRKQTKAQITAAFDLAQKWGIRAMGLETNNGWDLLKDDFDLEKKRREKAGEFCDLHIDKVVNSQNKTDRIATMEPKIANRWIGFREGLPIIYWEQMEQFPTAAKDDGPDATEGAIRTASQYETLFGGIIERSAA